MARAAKAEQLGPAQSDEQGGPRGQKKDDGPSVSVNTFREISCPRF